MNKTVICLLGASGSGKTATAQALCRKYGWNVIYSYTTRKPRYHNEWGHVFVNPPRGVNSILQEICKTGEVVALSRYGGEWYWATVEQFSSAVPNVYVVDRTGLVDLRHQLPNDFTVKSVFLHNSGAYERMVGRGDSGADVITKVMQDMTEFSVVDADICINTAFFGPDVVAEIIYNKMRGRR